MVDLDVAGDRDSFAYAVSGDQVGDSEAASGDTLTHCARRQLDACDRLGGGTNSFAYAVSDDRVAGPQGASAATHAFSWTATGRMVDLGTRPATYTALRPTSRWSVGSSCNAAAACRDQLDGSSGMVDRARYRAVAEAMHTPSTAGR
jgi:hypothetical protein